MFFYPAEKQYYYKFHIDPADPSHLVVELTFDSYNTKETLLILPDSLDYEKNLYLDLKNIKALMPNVLIEPTSNSARKIVKHKTNQTIKISYEVIGSEDCLKEYCVFISPEQIAFLGERALIFPDEVYEKKVNVVLDWSQLPSNLVPYNDYGVLLKKQTLKTSFKDLLHTQYIASAKLPILIQDESPRIYGFSFGLDWPKSASLVIQKNIENQLKLLDSTYLMNPFVIVSLYGIPNDTNFLKIVGSYWRNSYTVYIKCRNMSVPCLESLTHTLSHELWHYWIAGLVRCEGEATCLWFNEGFTEYLSYYYNNNLGLYPSASFFSDLNEMYGRYDTLIKSFPISASLMKTHYHSIPELSDIPYLQGFFIAKWLDHKIQDHSHGEKNLLDILKTLLPSDREHSTKLSEEQLYLILSQSLTPSEREEFFRAIYYHDLRSWFPAG